MGEGQKFAAPSDAFELRTSQNDIEAQTRQVAHDDGAAGRDRFGGQDVLADDAAVEDFADDGELGEFGHWRRVDAKRPD